VVGKNGRNRTQFHSKNKRWIDTVAVIQPGGCKKMSSILADQQPKCWGGGGIGSCGVSANDYRCTPGLALKNPPKKPTQKNPKNHLKKTIKSGFFWFFLGFFKFHIFYENNKNFSLSNRFFMNK
jgi:hypothetical protein